MDWSLLVLATALVFHLDGISANAGKDDDALAVVLKEEYVMQDLDQIEDVSYDKILKESAEGMHEQHQRSLNDPIKEADSVESIEQMSTLLPISIENMEKEEKNDDIISTDLVVHDAEGDNALTLILERKESNVVAISDALKAKGLSLAKLFAVRSSRGLMYRTILPGIKQWISDKISLEYSMNVKSAFLLMGKVGDLLRVSYAGCKGYNCQTSVARVHSRYQNLIYNSARVSGNFVRNSIRAIRYHYYATRRMDRDQLPKAFAWIKRTALIADRMVTESKYMVEQADVLTKLSEDALLATTSDDVTNKNQIKEFNAKMKNMTANVERINAMLEKQRVLEQQANDESTEAVRKYREWEKKHTTEASRKIKTNKKCSTSDTGVNLFGIKLGWSSKSCWDEVDQGDVNQKQVKLASYEVQIQSARDAYLKVLKMKNEIQGRNAELYGELAQTLEMKNLTDVKNDLERAQMSLEISIKVLTMVKTIFLESLAFWKKLSDHATTMGNKGDNMVVLKELGLDDAFEFKELLVGSGFNWLAFGKVAYEAAVTMHHVKADVTNTFVNLPSHEQAKQLIKTSGPLITTVQKMIKDLRKDEKATNKEIEEAEKAVKKEKEILTVLPEDRLTTTIKPSTVKPTTEFVIDLGGDLGGIPDRK